MIRLRRPSDSEIATSLPSEAFSYPEVGATAELGKAGIREALAARYDVDDHHFVLGAGRGVFERARSSLLAWRHFEIPWLRFHGCGGAVAEGQVVATVVHAAGMWFVSPCRVVYVESTPDPDRAAFAYGTLAGHAESGEERFEVSFDPASGRVRYAIAAFSRPAVLLARLGYPLARRLQKRFALASAQALARAAEHTTG